MKKYIVGLLYCGLLAIPSSVSADLTIRELFRETEGAVLDFAILSSVEAGYARDLINGRSLALAQTPILYVTPYITFDGGYVTGYDDKSRGALMVGGSLRLNRLIEDYFTDKVSVVKRYTRTLTLWEKLWVGPFVSARISDFEDNNFMAGIKAGLSFSGFGDW